MEISNLEGEAPPGAVINSYACDTNESAVEKTPMSSAKVLTDKINSPTNSSAIEESNVIQCDRNSLSENNHSSIDTKKQTPKRKTPKKLTNNAQNKPSSPNSVSNNINKVKSKLKIKNSNASAMPQIPKPSKVGENCRKDLGSWIMSRSGTQKDSVKPNISNSIVIEEVRRSKPMTVVDSTRSGASKECSQLTSSKEPSSTLKEHCPAPESKPYADEDFPKNSSSKEAFKPGASKEFPAPSAKRDVVSEATVPSMSRRKYLYLFRSRSHHVVVKKHGIKVYKCDICSGEYRQNFSLKRHFLRSHVNAKYVSKSDILNCKIREGILNLNSRKEETSTRKKSKGENEIFLENNDNRAMPNLFKCHICSNVTFDLDKEIRAHYKRHHSEGQKKKFACDTCGAIFVRKQFLIKHKATHRPTPAFVCQECDLHFTSKSEYKKHALSHSHNKSVCRTCLKSFSSTANRKRHEKLHQGPIRKRGRGKQPKKAETANRQSPSKSASTPVVQPLKVKICPVCSKAFSSVVAMLKHRSKKHPFLVRRRRTQRNHVPKVLTKKDLAALARKSEYDFYCNVSQRIADNLLHYLDGKAKTLSLKKYNFNDHTEPSSYYKDLICLPWSSFNFPIGFDVDYAIRNRGQEIKQKQAENLSVRERSLYATGLNKVPLSSESSSNCNGSIWSESSNDASEMDSISESSFLNDSKELSLEERRKLIGKHLIVVCLCTICKESFTSYADYYEHCENNHPNIECSCIEIEGDKHAPPQVPVDLCRQCVSSDGVFFSCSVPPPFSQAQAHLLRCTKCKTNFKSSMELHKHILDCGGNECAVAKYVKPQTKRIKRTMKNRMDLSAKKSPLKKMNEKNHFYKNGRLQTTSMKCDKNYFSTKPVKQMKSTLNLKQKPQLKQKVECPTCNRVFRSQVNLKSHVILCFKRTSGCKKAESNGHSSKMKLTSSSSLKEPTLTKDIIPKGNRVIGNEIIESQAVGNSTNFQNIPVVLNSNSIINKNIPNANSTKSSVNSLRILTNAKPGLPKNGGVEDTAVDLSVKAQICDQKSLSAGLSPTQDSPKVQSAYDKAMEAATEFAKSMPKMKKSPISSLSETVKRLTKQLSGRVTGLETFSLEVGPSKKSPRKQAGPSGLKTTAPDSNKNDLNYAKKIEHKGNKHIFPKPIVLPEKVPAENLSSIAKKDALSMKTPAANLNSSNSKTLLNSSKIIATLPEKKIPKLVIKISSGSDEDQKTISLKKVSVESSENSSPAKSNPNLLSNETADVSIVNTLESILNSAALSENANECKKKDFVSENPSTNENVNTELKSINASLNGIPLVTPNNKSDTSFSSMDISDTQSDNDSTDKLPVLSNSVLFLPTKKQTKSRRSSGSQGRISPSLESIVNSIKQKLHSQELDPPQQCVSWLEDEKFVIPSSSPKLRLPVNINPDSLSVSKKLDFQPIKEHQDNSEDSGLLESDSVADSDKVKSSRVFSVQSVNPNEKPASTESSDISCGANDLSNAVNKSKDAADIKETSKIEISEAPEPPEMSIEVVALKKSKSKVRTSAENSISPIKTSKKGSRWSRKKLSKTNSGMELASPKTVCESTVPEENNKADTMSAKPRSTSQNSSVAMNRSSQLNSSQIQNKIKKTSFDLDKTVKSQVLDLNKAVLSGKEVPVGESCKSSIVEEGVSKIYKSSSSKEKVSKDEDQASVTHEASLSSKVSYSSEVNDHPRKKNVNSGIVTDDANIDKPNLVSAVSTKKRGRPRKNIPHLEAVSESITEAENVVLKRKPGRPKRKGLNHVPDETLKSNVTKAAEKRKVEMLSIPSTQLVNQSEEAGVNVKNISSSINLSKKADDPREVRSVFGRNLASKMKEKMRLSFKSASTDKPTPDLSSNSANDPTIAIASNIDVTEPGKDASTDEPSTCGKLSPLASQVDAMVKAEHEFKEESTKHFCPFCLGEFAYLTNYRRHLKVCRERFNTNGIEYETVPQSTSGLLQYLPKKDEVESSMLDLARHQSRQSQLMKETENNASNKKGFRTYSCRFCHRIYLSLFQFLQHQMNSHKIIKSEVDMDPRSDQSMFQSLAIKSEDSMSVDGRTEFCEDSRYLPEEKVDSESPNMVSMVNFIDPQNTPPSSMCEMNDENEQDFVEEINSRSEQSQVNQSAIEPNTESEITLKSSTEASRTEDHSSNEVISKCETLGKDQTEFTSFKKEDAISEKLTPHSIESTVENKVENDSVLSFKNVKNVPSYHSGDLKESIGIVGACNSAKAMGSKRGRRRRWKGHIHNFVRRKASATNLAKKQKSDNILNKKALILAKNSEEKTSIVKGSKQSLLNPNKNIIFHKIKRKFMPKKSKNCTKGVISLSEKAQVDNLKTEVDLKDEKLSMAENSAAVVNDPKMENDQLEKALGKEASGSKLKKEKLLQKGKKVMKFAIKRTIPSVEGCSDAKSTKRGRPKTKKDPVAVSESPIPPVPSPKIPSTSQKDITPKRKYVKKSILFSPPSTSKTPHSSSSTFQSKTRNAKGLQAFSAIDDSSNDEDVAPTDVSAGPNQKKKRAKICPVCKKKFPATLLRNRHIQLIHSRKTPASDLDAPSTSPENLKKKRSVSELSNRNIPKRVCKKPSPDKRPKE